MGADLYIKDMPEEAQYTGFEVSERAVDVGYFRDCYNPGDLFAFLTQNSEQKFSWWAMMESKELFNEEGEMTVDGAKKFLSRIKRVKKHIGKKNSLYKADWSAEAKDKPRLMTIKEVVEYMDWLNLLIRFLELAIKKKSNITFSV